MDENDPSEFPTPEQDRQNQGIDESEMETEDEQSIQEEQNLGNDETMLTVHQFQFVGSGK